MNLTINRDQVLDELETLASFSDAPAPAVTRVVFSEPDLQGRAYLKGLCAAAGLDVRVDPVGNTFARWIGREPRLPAIGTGSHIDAIPQRRTLRRHGRRARRPRGDPRALRAPASAHGVPSSC